jgi:hypothetical protein
MNKHPKIVHKWQEGWMDGWMDGWTDDPMD